MQERSNGKFARDADSEHNEETEVVNRNGGGTRNTRELRRGELRRPPRTTSTVGQLQQSTSNNSHTRNQNNSNNSNYDPNQLSLHARPASFAGVSASTRQAPLNRISPFDSIPSTSTSNVHGTPVPSVSPILLDNGRLTHNETDRKGSQVYPRPTPRRAKSVERDRAGSSHSPKVAQGNSPNQASTSTSLTLNHSRESEPSSGHNSASKTGQGSSRTKYARSCAKCSQPMTGQFVRALGTVFHLDCFRCQVNIDNV